MKMMTGRIEDDAEADLSKGNPASCTRTKSRVATKESSAAIEADKMKEVLQMPSGSTQRKKALSKEANKGKGKKKVSTVSIAIVDVVYGGLQNFVADVDEHRRKRESDILKCGQVVRTVGNASTRSRIPQETEAASDVSALQKTSHLDVSMESRKSQRQPSPGCLSSGESH